MQLDYRAMIARGLATQLYVHATLEGLSRIFPPIEPPRALQVGRAIDALLLGQVPSMSIHDLIPTMELLKECLGEAGIVVDDVSTPSTPLALGVIRYRWARDPR